MPYSKTPSNRTQNRPTGARSPGGRKPAGRTQGSRPARPGNDRREGGNRSAETRGRSGDKRGRSGNTWGRAETWGPRTEGDQADTRRPARDGAPFRRGDAPRGKGAARASQPGVGSRSNGSYRPKDAARGGKARWTSSERAARRPVPTTSTRSVEPAEPIESAVESAPLPRSTLAEVDTAGMTFADLGLGRDLVAAIAALGATSPFPIQAATIPAVLAGGDVLGRGRTGSGKTLAFGAPLVARLAGSAPRKKAFGRLPRALVLAPTRELAMQINRTLEPLARSARLFTCVVVGGVPQQRQVQGLRRGVDIVIGTPGRLEDLIEQGHLDLSEVGTTVVDEADHMCDLGFLEPVQRLLRQTREGGQRLLYSATLDRAVGALVAEFLTDPSVHEVPGEDQASATIDHRLLQIEHRDKIGVIADLVDPKGKTLVFARTRAYAETLAEELSQQGLSTTSLHGDLTQAKRSRNLKLLTDGRVQVLVATDVAARGIHVDDIDLVVQADPPEDPKTYLHRSGRTGRAGRTGTVVTLTTRQRRFKTERLLRDAEITAVSAVARPGDRILAELGRRAG